MIRRTLSAVLAVALAQGLVAACATPQRPAGPPGRAVVVYAADRHEDAVGLGGRLSERSFEVELVPEGPSVRTASSAAVYDAARRPDRLELVEAALTTCPDATVLPFRQAGPKGTDVVVWLVSAGRLAP